MADATIDIILYHDVAKNAEEAERLSNPVFTTPLPKLRAHLEWLSHSGYKAIRLGEWLGARSQKETWAGKHILITFDGPHTGWFKHVIPLLMEMALPATFFVIAGWVGERHAFPESRHLKWDDLAKIESLKDQRGRQLFDVGCHSMWHTTLDKQPSENESDYLLRLEEEITRATGLVRVRTGYEVRTYATPEGDGNLNVLRPIFESAGLEAVRWASLPAGKNSYGKDLLDLQISYCDTVHQAADQLSISLSNRWAGFFKKVLRRALCGMRRAERSPLGAKVCRR